MTNNFRLNQYLGPITGFVVGGSTPLNAAANWFSCSFAVNISKTINSIRLLINGVTGTLSAGDMRLDIYSSTGNPSVPNASLANSTTVTTLPTSGTAPVFAEWTGFSLALTAGTTYWLVVRNLDASPTVNYFSMPGFDFSTPISGHFNQFVGPGAHGKGCSLTSSNSGSSWSVVGNGSFCPFRFAYSDSTYDGFPYVSQGTDTFRSYANNESGVFFTIPSSWPTVNVIGAVFSLSVQVANPTVGPTYRLFSGSSTSPMSTSETLDIGLVSTTGSNGFYALFFSSAQALSPGNSYRLTCYDNTDSVSNRYSLLNYNFENDANSLALLPFNGTLKNTVLTSGTTWTDTSASYSPFALILDPTGEFTSSGGTSLFPRGILSGGRM